MNYTRIIALAIVFINILFSWKGFNSRTFFNKYAFEVERIRLFREYRRLLTSGFLHVSWKHLLFNMASLLAFSFLLETNLTATAFAIIYFGSLIGGNLLSLYVHRRENDYSAVGASGAICGVIFAAVAMYPDRGVDVGGLFSVPGWVYGLGYLLLAIYGIRSRRDNIGHDAHLGGAMVGILIALFIEPGTLRENFAVVIALLVPCIFFMYVIINKPQAILVDNYHYNQHHVFVDIDDQYNMGKASQQKELDAILEKIHQRGMQSLTKTEKDKLELYSRQIN
ncbi:rhomboid family protein [Chitinophaga arvensicola]|uniref:Membrane associated serine protease, rhomboid family n=1 Tax=Chitinophaga arvensicola TaxID=29529 RepID=A0A1I0QY10_9BACT|nr:rhomboid family intramembrane serine protease [Chitinophaga arvensicola]SEW32716.1 Membrane associated serine protease, rhomboid family [Chitinophaga arvensicola]